MRWLAWRLNSPHYKKGQAPRTASAYWPFPWEQEERRKEMEEMASRHQAMTEEEQERLNKLFANRNDEQDR